MSIGAYGTTIPIHLDNVENMVDISYCYHEKRSFDALTNATFKSLPSNVLRPATREADGNFDDVIEGMYDLKLPLSEFNKKGFYTVYIKPKEYDGVILDVAPLTAFHNVRGLIIDTSSLPTEIQGRALENNGLVGYRIIYINDGGKRLNYYRIITSNNRCEPVIQAPASSSDKSYTYRYDDSSGLIFVTVSPSSAPTFKENATPYIGKPTQKILLVNTFFEPIMLDIEMTTHDADTISYMLENSQLRNIDNGLVTTFNDNNEIYNQSEHFTLKDQYTGKPVYEVKENKKNNIDFSQTIDDKI